MIVHGTILRGGICYDSAPSFSFLFLVSEGFFVWRLNGGWESLVALIVLGRV